MNFKDIIRKGIDFDFAKRKAAKREGSIGLDIGSETVICLELGMRQDRPYLKQFVAVDMLETGTKPRETLRNIFESQSFSTRKVRVAIGGPTVIVRYIDLPYMTDKELDSCIRYEAEKYIPFKTDDVYIDFHVLGKTPAVGAKRRVNVLLVAAKKEKVNELIKLGKEAGFEIEVVNAAAIALINAFQWSHPEMDQKRICQVDFGARYTTVNIIDEGTPVFTRDVSFGGEDIVGVLAKQLNVSFDEAHNILSNFDWKNAEWKEAIARPFTHLTSEVRLSINYFERQLSEGKDIQKVFIHGGVSMTPGFQGSLEKELGRPVQYANPVSRLELGAGLDRTVIDRYAQQLMVAMGLALQEGES